MTRYSEGKGDGEEKTRKERKTRKTGRKGRKERGTRNGIKEK
jgi:hypothetical protein